MIKALYRRVVLARNKPIFLLTICVMFTLTSLFLIKKQSIPHCTCCENVTKNETKGKIAVIESKTNIARGVGNENNQTLKIEDTKTKEKTAVVMPSKYVDFHLVLPFIEPNLQPQERNVYVAVVVNSAAKGEKHRNLRQTIRETWGNTTRSGNSTAPTRPWKLFFSLGIADNATEQELNLKEAREHNDIIIGNFTDTYRNVVIKTFMAHFWAVTKLSCDYVLKTDDDVYVRVPGLISWLIKSGSPKQFFGGVISKFHEVPRNPNSPWYITREQYSEPNWPPWCHGSYHVLSSDVVPNYLIYTYKKKPFHTDDAYIGVASRDLGVRVNQIPGFTVDHVNPRRIRPEKELRNVLTFGHQVTAEDMLRYYKFYKDNNIS